MDDSADLLPSRKRRRLEEVQSSCEPATDQSGRLDAEGSSHEQDPSGWVLIQPPDKDGNSAASPASPGSSTTWASVEIPCARWCKLQGDDDGAYEWDDSKISSFLSETERSSPDSVKAILSGRVLSLWLFLFFFSVAVVVVSV